MYEKIIREIFNRDEQEYYFFHILSLISFKDFSKNVEKN